MDIQTNKLETSGTTCDHCEQTISEREIDGDTSVMEAFDLIIVGGGSAAFSAAIKASEFGKRVLMINAGLPIGGTCVNVGCVPSKTLLRGAEQFHISNNPGFTGIRPGESKLNFSEIIRQKSEMVTELRRAKYTDVLRDDPNVTIVEARARFIDSNAVEADGRRYTAGNILIATGAAPFLPDVPGLAESGYLTNETLYDLDELPEHLLIIGGRYIALESAQLFARFGSRVTILQRSPRILPDETPDITAALTEFLEDEKIVIKTGVTLRSVERRNGNVTVKVTVRGREETFEGSHLFAAAGRKGNTAGMGLEEAGIKRQTQDFIETNEYLQTSRQNVYAAGDVTGERLFVYAAAYEGALAVGNMFGERRGAKDYSVFPWVVFTDPQLAGVGMDENEAHRRKIDYQVSVVQLKDVPRSIAARNTRGFIKLLRNKDDDRLIGARVLATEGSELLMEISMAIKYGITVRELKEMFHPYLTLAEAVKIAAIGFDKDVGTLSCCAV